jgi:signal transduction histidine kinase
VTAHEFRTPLSVALFQIQDLLDSYEHSPEVNEDIKKVEIALGNLKDLTQKLFDVQKYDLNKMEYNPVKLDIVEYISDIYNGFKPSAAEKHIDLNFENHIKGKLPIDLDAPQFRQVIHNLLNNALKFTPSKGGKIIIDLSSDSKKVFIRISDNGKGISEDEKKKIFEKFHAEKHSTAAGIGLGLYLCFKIVELHKGNIYVEDSPGGGASFIVELPQ